jgi:hypothetical protein
VRVVPRSDPVVSQTAEHPRCRQSDDVAQDLRWGHQHTLEVDRGKSHVVCGRLPKTLPQRLHLLVLPRRIHWRQILLRLPGSQQAGEQRKVRYHQLHVVHSSRTRHTELPIAHRSPRSQMRSQHKHLLERW